MSSNKEYFKTYYEKNKDKIIFRVKQNYAKNKNIKPLEIKKNDITEFESINETKQTNQVKEIIVKFTF